MDYSEVLDMAIVDRAYFIEFMKAKQQATQKAIEEQESKMKSKRKK